MADFDMNMVTAVLLRDGAWVPITPMSLIYIGSVSFANPLGPPGSPGQTPEMPFCGFTDTAGLYYAVPMPKDNPGILAFRYALPPQGAATLTGEGSTDQ